jgi:hypothetical protein
MTLCTQNRCIFLGSVTSFVVDPPFPGSSYAVLRESLLDEAISGSEQSRQVVCRREMSLTAVVDGTGEFAPQAGNSLKRLCRDAPSGANVSVCKFGVIGGVRRVDARPAAVIHRDGVDQLATWRHDKPVPGAFLFVEPKPVIGDFAFDEIADLG